MRFVRQSTQRDVVIGPVWATADGALKSDLAYNAPGINCDVYKVGTKADVTLANSSGDGYFRAGSGEAQYILTLSTGHTDTIGMLRLTLSATAYYMKPEDFMVLDESVYDVLFGTTAPSTLAAGAAMTLTGAYDAAKNAAPESGGNIATILSRIVGTLATGTHTAQSGDSYAKVNSGTYGLSALKALIDDMPTNAELASALEGADDDVLTAIGNLNDYDGSDTAGVTTLLERIIGTLAAGTHNPQSGDAYATAAKLETMLEADGENYQYTEGALENAPAGEGGEADWTTNERKQIRDALGVDGDKTAAASGDLQALAAAIAALVDRSFTVVSPVSAAGDAIEIVQGDDYADADARALTWTDNAWPDLSAGTIKLRLERATGTLEITCGLTGSYPGAQVIKAELTDAQTATLDIGMGEFQLVATLASENVVTLAYGTLNVTKYVAPAA
ncbi:MAG: hypothetical protein JW990_21210 [Thermoleophilia bacterium]|nr:hypothetical protein [Thermoleophilia bacterium]